MNRNRLFLLFLLVTGLVASANASPMLAVEKTAHDFGRITQGDILSYTYRLHNAGDAPLEISQVRSSCGCTAALLSSRRLEPGEMGEMKVSFDSAGFRGKVQKQITFDTNDPTHPVVNLILSGDVKAELYADPKRVNWGRVKVGTALQQELIIANDSERTIVFKAVESSNPDITVELSSMRINPGTTEVLSVSTVFPAGRKRLSGYISLQSDFIRVPELRVPVSARLSTN